MSKWITFIIERCPKSFPDEQFHFTITKIIFRWAESFYGDLFFPNDQPESSEWYNDTAILIWSKTSHDTYNQKNHSSDQKSFFYNQKHSTITKHFFDKYLYFMTTRIFLRWAELFRDDQNHFQVSRIVLRWPKSFHVCKSFM